MEFNCNVKIVDMIMGSGKSSAAINYINQSDGEKFLYITPFKDEINDRIIPQCAKKNFVQPEKFGTKLNGLKYLVERGQNIVSTHALFHRFDREIIDMCRSQNYTLILDEVTDVIEEYQISPNDFNLLKENYIYIDENTGFIRWREDQENYNGKFSEEKRLCEMNCLAFYGGSVMMWLFPIEAFNAFRSIYILTYMFNAQIQRYYYDYYGLPYKYIYVIGDRQEDYQFTENFVSQRIRYDYSQLIHILDHEKMNQIGDSTYDLSMNWYKRNKNNVVMKKLKSNLNNFFRNITKTPSNLNLWTTFKEYKPLLSGKGYGRGYLQHTARATNKYKDRVSIAYVVNKFLNGTIKNFFMQNNIEVDEDGYALSEMLQFIWRSAAREGKEIQVYIPSIRMRTLLVKWIDENKKNFDNAKNS